jgi:hypothetical protein
VCVCVCIQPKRMAEKQEISPMLSINYKRRNLSQTPTPSSGLILKKLSQGYITVSSVKNRRAVSEQVNHHDR